MGNVCRKICKVMKQDRFQVKSNPRGIPESKNRDIVTKLFPMMDKQHQNLWKYILTNDVVDLVDNRC